MKTLLRLKREARAACEQRGHTMYRWYSLGYTVARSACVYCGKEVQVNANPAPNDIDIGGEAVALTCE